jgi:branched-chain amino acid transport system substrate-binding protein
VIHPRNRRAALRATLLSAAIAVTFGFASPVQAQAKFTDNAVRIGVLTDMSSVSSDNSGKGSVLAAEMAIKDFSPDAKVLGMPIELISADHQGKTDLGASIAREWYDRRGVDMITDLTFSNVALAVEDVAREKKRLTLITGAGSAAITNEACSPYNVHWMYDTYALSKATANALLKQGLKNWYFITADYAFGQALEKDARAVVTKSGGNILGAVKHPINSPDQSSYLLQAQNSKAQVIALANAGIDTLNSVKTANEFGIGAKSGQAIVPLLSLITEVKGMGENARGMYLTTGFYWDMDAQSRAFSERFFALHKKMPTMMQAAVYSAVLHYLKSIQAAGTDNAETVMATMRRTEVNDAVVRKGRIREDGRLVHDMLLVQVQAPTAAKNGWDLYKIVQTIPGDDAFQSLAESRCPAIKK